VTPNAGNSIEQEQQLEDRQRAADGRLRSAKSTQMNIGSSVDTGGKDIVHVGRGGPGSVVEATVFLPILSSYVGFSSTADPVSLYQKYLV
jgi:hypothetical protein